MEKALYQRDHILSLGNLSLNGPNLVADTWELLVQEKCGVEKSLLISQSLGLWCVYMHMLCVCECICVVHMHVYIIYLYNYFICTHMYIHTHTYMCVARILSLGERHKQHLPSS